MKTLKQWWATWAIVDILSLGLGLGLTVTYVWFRYTYPLIQNAYIELWPNIASEVVGVWVSVRVIDWLIQRREGHHHTRRRVVGSLGYFLGITERLLPYCSSGSVRDLENELRLFDESFPIRRKLLSPDEVTDVEAAVATAQTILKTAQSYRSENHKAEDARLAIDRAFDQMNLASGIARVYLHQFLWFTRVEHEHRRLKDRSEFDAAALQDATAELAKNVVPPAILPLFNEYLAAVTAASGLHVTMLGQVDAYKRQALKARANIYEESGQE